MLLVVIRTLTACAIMPAMRMVTQVSSTKMIVVMMMTGTTTALGKRDHGLVVKRASHLYVKDVSLAPVMATRRVVTQQARAALFPPAMLPLYAAPSLLESWLLMLIRVWLGSALLLGSKNVNDSSVVLKTLKLVAHLFARGRSN